jgi:hypothetical protein
VLNNKDMAIPADATWSAQFDNKRAWGTSIKNQPGGDGQQNTGHVRQTEISIKCAKWKSLLNNLYLDSATRNMKGEDEAYKFASRNTLGGILVSARFFDPEPKSFTQDPLFMVIALRSTGLDSPALTLMADKVWGGDKLLHLLGHPVTDMGDDPQIPVCGTVSSECLSGLYPTPIRESILRTPAVWCVNGDVDFLVGAAPHKMSVENEIKGWIGVNDLKEMDYHREILFPAFTEEAASTSVFNLLPMALPPPFNHDPVGYTISGIVMGENMIEAWNVFVYAG